MKVKKTRIFFRDLRGTFGSLWFYEAGDSLVLFHFPFLSSDKILMQQNMIHTISEDFFAMEVSKHPSVAAGIGHFGRKVQIVPCNKTLSTCRRT